MLWSWRLVISVSIWARSQGGGSALSHAGSASVADVSGSLPLKTSRRLMVWTSLGLSRR